MKNFPCIWIHHEYTTRDCELSTIFTTPYGIHIETHKLLAELKIRLVQFTNGIEEMVAIIELFLVKDISMDDFKFITTGLAACLIGKVKHVGAFLYATSPKYRTFKPGSKFYELQKISFFPLKFCMRQSRIASHINS